MKKLRLWAGALFVVAAASVVWTGIAGAHSFRSGTNVTVGQDEQINDTLFVYGRTIDINSEVFGDIFCAGMSITISGTVHGDVICAGQTLNISGNIDGDVRLAGQTMTVGATVSGNATVAGQTFILESTGTVEGDVSVATSEATINGPVGRDFAASSGNVVIASTVGRDIEATLSKLRLTSSANVTGDITYTSANDIDRADGARVGGEVTRNEPAQEGTPKRGAVFGFAIGWFIYWFLAMLLTAMALALLFPRMLQAVTDRALPTPWKALLTGFLASIVLPVVLVVLAVTVIGLPLAFIVGLLWFVVALLSGPVFGFYIGRLILRESRQPLLIMLVGASLLLVLYFIPIIGAITLLAAFWIGAGMLLLEVFGRTPKPTYELSQPATKRK